MPKAPTPVVPTATGTILGDCILYKDYGESGEREIGACRGDVEFGVNREWRHQDYNGMRGKTKGKNVKNKVNCYIKIPLLELSRANIEDVYQGLSSTDEGAYHSVTESFDVDDADYWTNAAVVGQRSDGKYYIAIIENPLGMSDIIQAFKTEDDVVQELQLDGNYLTTAPDTVPYELRFED